ncbi:MAG: organic hydroperoxide resistance protein [Proteobacteria bacterium]|nr:MAG: organic hydroperoxide resistance protein [Pseudomonadota bacterium]
MKPDKVLYTAEATATGGREGRAQSANKSSLDIKLSTPKELGGAGGEGTNPEELFAAGYSACFIGAMKAVAAREKIALPADVSVAGKVGIGPSGSAFAIDVELKVSIPGFDKAKAEALVEKAHQVCPYSNATRGNVDVRISVI